MTVGNAEGYACAFVAEANAYTTLRKPEKKYKTYG